jgi:hypothetical protein
MSMMPPPFRANPSDDGIPAADPGQGAPEPAPGFGVGGEDPDVVRDQDPPPEDAEQAERPEATPFGTPDPQQIGPDAGGATQPKRPEM